MLLDFVGVNDSNTAGTAGAGQTTINDTLTNGCRFLVSNKTVAAPSLTSMSWTFGAGNAVSQGIIEIIGDAIVPLAFDNSIFFGTHF